MFSHLDNVHLSQMYIVWLEMQRAYVNGFLTRVFDLYVRPTLSPPHSPTLTPGSSLVIHSPIGSHANFSNFQPLPKLTLAYTDFL
jgi:hypothetical protein